MEIDRQIIQSAINKSKNASFHKELEHLFAEVAKQPIDEVFNNKKAINLQILFETLDCLIAKSGSMNSEVQNECIDGLSSVVALQISYFDKAITATDLTALYISERINCFTNIPLDTLFEQISFEPPLRDRLNKAIIDLLTKLQFNINAHGKAPYHEKLWIDRYFTGYDSDDIDKVYYFIDSVERGVGFSYDPVLKKFANYVLTINKQDFIKMISCRKYPHEFILFFESISYKDKLNLGLDNPPGNKWCIFELIRQILKERNYQDVLKQTSLEILLKYLQDIDLSFLVKVIDFFGKDLSFNKAVGRVLAKASEAELTEVINCCYIFNKNSYNLEVRTELLKEFIASAPHDDVYRYLLSELYHKWKLFFYQLVNDKDAFLNDIVLTDYANFIVQYHIDFATNDEIITELEKSVADIKAIDNKWFKNQIHQTSYFFLKLSLINILSYAIKSKGIATVELNTALRKVLLNPLFISRFFHHKDHEKIVQHILDNMSAHDE